jgi:hypothetical protein
MHEIHAVALFRYSVLGALVSRGRLERGELKATIRELAARDYDIPGSRHSRISEKTIEAWYSAQSKIMRSETEPDQHGQAIGRRSTAHNKGRGHSLVSSAISSSGGRKSPLRRLSGLSGLIASSICVGSARRYISVVCTLAWPSQSATLRISPVA